MSARPSSSSRLAANAGIIQIHAHFANVVSVVALLAAEFGRYDGFRWSFTIQGPTEFDEVRRYALAGKVRRAAFVACISDYCRSQLLKLAEFAEGVPVGLREAMAIELPVVTTRIARIPGLVEAGRAAHC